MRRTRKALVLVAVAAALFGASGIADAGHPWANYHWGRSANPFTVQVGNNVTSGWQVYFNTALADWSSTALNASNPVSMQSVPGTSNKRNCSPTVGTVQVCNNRYGFNGWLGVASIWIDSQSHIVQGTVKLNDNYFSTTTYNTVAWKNLVMCQEVGHTLGLAHQDENFNNANLNTCMDYTNNPGTNQHPNQHDYDQLVTIYGHLDASTTLAAPRAQNNGAGAGRGSPFGEDDALPPGAGPQHGDVFVKDLGNGNKVITHVFWVRPGASGN